MTDKDKQLAIIWCALNAEIEPIEIMNAIERITNPLVKWREFFDAMHNPAYQGSGMVDDIRKSLKKDLR